MTSTRVDVSLRLLEGIGVVKHGTTTRLEKTREVRRIHIQLVALGTGNLVLDLFGRVAIRVKELNALLFIKEAAPVSFRLALREEENEAPPFAVKEVLGRPKTFQLGIREDFDVSAEDVANVSIGQRICFDSF